MGTSINQEYLGGQLLIGTEVASRGLGDAVPWPKAMPMGNAVKCLEMVVEAMASCRFSIVLL